MNDRDGDGDRDSDWTDKRLDDRFTMIADRFDAIDKRLDEIHDSIREQQGRRATIVVALIGAFALIASSAIGVLVVVLQHHP